MDGIAIALVLLISLTGGLLLRWFVLRIRGGQKIGLRPLLGYTAMENKIGLAVESGRGIHLGLGTGSLTGSASPASVSALLALDYLAVEGCRSGKQPMVTVGDGTLLLAGQDRLWRGFRLARRTADYDPTMAEFLADNMLPFTYAAGVSDIINRGELGTNMLFGRFGPEMGIMLEAADRANMEHVVATDDPLAMAVATPVTKQIMLGEELFAAGAYLRGDTKSLASVQLQDIIRIVAIIGILLAAIIGLVVGT
jgi:hypothetical protein